MLYIENNFSGATPLYRELPYGRTLISYSYTKTNGKICFINDEELRSQFILMKKVNTDNKRSKGVIVDKRRNIIHIMEDYKFIYSNDDEVVLVEIVEMTEISMTFTSFVLTEKTIHVKKFKVDPEDFINFSKTKPLLSINGEEYDLCDTNDMIKT